MIFVDLAKCTGCSICSLVCPHGVFSIEDKKARLTHEERCVECGACQLNCEQKAIFVTKGTGCLTAIIKEDILKIKEKGCG